MKFGMSSGGDPTLEMGGVIFNTIENTNKVQIPPHPHIKEAECDPPI